MAPDDLNTPLGQDKGKKTPRRLPLSPPQIFASVLGLGCLVVAAWALVAEDPLGGEPYAIVSTKPAAPGLSDADRGKATSRYDGPDGAGTKPSTTAANGEGGVKAPAVPPGAKTITIIDGSSGKRQDVIIPGNGAPDKTPDKSSSLAPPAEPAAQEASRHGSIPKVGANGARASALYARPRVLPASRKDAPRIALIVAGLGISASATADAFAGMPAAVTFALSPYAADLERLAERARNEEHEVLLQAPMEPFDYPDNDPGPQTLLTSLPVEQNIDRLHWLMSRAKGYVGLVSYMGSRFTTSDAALTPVLRETAKRGLIFVDAGASARSVAGQIAAGHHLPFAKADVVLDSVPTPVEIDRALARLESTARENGAAVGIATAQPATVARIADWTAKVEERGFVLVPISMVAVKAKSS